MNIHNQNKSFMGKFRSALYDLDIKKLSRQLNSVFATDAQIHIAHPIEDVAGPKALYKDVYKPLVTAIPDLERRDYIVMAGNTPEGVDGLAGNWVGCAGYYTGVFEKPWLDIPPTQHPIHMRYHEFFRIEDNKIVEMQALWDIPEVMMQASAWPMAPSLGVEWLVPSPATQDGVITKEFEAEHAATSRKIVFDMLTGLEKNDGASSKKMGLDSYWHQKMNWYGPAGIGSNRRISGFRNWHQIPFLKALPDRGGDFANGILFADNDYVGFTAWPGMFMTVSGDGWMGIAPSGKEITMRSLDFWRCEGGLIRENWVLVDILDVYHQLGVDVFERMREMTIARQPNRQL